MACFSEHPIDRNRAQRGDTIGRACAPSRRDFLTVGAVAGLGLSLGDFFAIRHAQAEQKHYDFVEAKAKSVGDED